MSKYVEFQRDVAQTLLGIERDRNELIDTMFQLCDPNTPLHQMCMGRTPVICVEKLLQERVETLLENMRDGLDALLISFRQLTE